MLCPRSHRDGGRRSSTGMKVRKTFPDGSAPSDPVPRGFSAGSDEGKRLGGDPVAPHSTSWRWHRPRGWKSPPRVRNRWQGAGSCWGRSAGPHSPVVLFKIGFRATGLGCLSPGAVAPCLSAGGGEGDGASPAGGGRPGWKHLSLPGDGNGFKRIAQSSQKRTSDGD